MHPDVINANHEFTPQSSHDPNTFHSYMNESTSYLPQLYNRQPTGISDRSSEPRSELTPYSARSRITNASLNPTASMPFNQTDISALSSWDPSMQAILHNNSHLSAYTSTHHHANSFGAGTRDPFISSYSSSYLYYPTTNEAGPRHVLNVHTPGPPWVAKTSTYNISAPSGSGTVQCCWDNACPILLDDQTASGMNRHIKDYHAPPGSNGRTRWTCQWGGSCGKDMNLGSLGKHIAECHLKSTMTTCPYCGTICARADVLQRHLDSCLAYPENAGGHSH